MEAAEILRTTVGKVKRLLKVARENPEDLPNMHWGTGSWQKPEEATNEQKDWVTDPQRLREQVGLSLKARKDAFNDEFEL